MLLIVQIDKRFYEHFKSLVFIKNKTPFWRKNLKLHIILLVPSWCIPKLFNNTFYSRMQWLTSLSTWWYAYEFQPLMVGLSDICSPPSFKIKYIHAIEPCTLVTVKVGWYHGMWKVQEINIFTSRAAAFLTPRLEYWTTDFAIKVKFPQRRYVMLYYNIIIQQYYLVEIWKQLCWYQNQNTKQPYH